MWMNSPRPPPSGETAEVQFERGNDGVPAGDVRGRAEVVIAERLVISLTLRLMRDPVAGVQAGLHGDLADPRQLLQAHHAPPP